MHPICLPSRADIGQGYWDNRGAEVVGYAYKSEVDDSSLKSSDVNIMPIQTCNSTLAEKAQQQLECKTSKIDNLALSKVKPKSG